MELLGKNERRFHVDISVQVSLFVLRFLLRSLKLFLWLPLRGGVCGYDSWNGIECTDR